MRTTRAILFAASVTVAFPVLAGPKVYVPMGSADEVTVIDAEQDKVVGSIKAITESHGLAGSSDGRFLIAGSLAEMSADAGQPPKPEDMAQDEHESHHAGGASAGAKNTGSLSYLTVISTEGGAVERRISVPGSVHHTLIAPDDRYAVATHPGEEGISAVDLATYAVKTIRTGPNPNYALASPNGENVYVSNAGNNTISIIDTERWIVRRNIEVGAEPEHMTLSADGTALYVNNTGDGTVSVVSLPKGTVTKSFTVGGDIHGIDLSEDGNTLFVAGREENKVVAININSGQVRSQPLAPSPYHLASIKGTSKLYISSAEDDKIWVVDQSTLKIIKEIPVSDRAHQMVVLQ